MEQYLTEDGCDKLCDAWEEPEEQYEPTRVAFFIRKSSSTVLETPYGNIDMSNPAKLSETLKQIFEFEKELFVDKAFLMCYNDLNRTCQGRFLAEMSDFPLSL